MHGSQRHALLAASALAATALSCASAIDLQPHDSRYEICGQRAFSTPPHGHLLTVTGTIHRIVDGTPTDGAVSIVAVDPQGAPKKLHFGSL